jgi:Ca2+-binding RTX toxin-like protein
MCVSGESGGADCDGTAALSGLQGLLTGRGQFRPGTEAQMVEITGSGGSDTIGPAFGAEGAPRPGEGDDRLDGQGGADSLQGGGGIDTLLGGEGDDTLAGGAEIDLLAGGPGTDWLSYADDTAGVSIDLYFLSARGGEAEGDSIAPGFEALLGGSGADAIIAHDAVHETILGAEGADTLLGFGDFGTSDDLLRGGGGDDSVVAQAGANTLDGGEGNDVLRGGAGRDLLLGGAGADSMAGGTGLDTLSYAGAGAGIVLDLALGTGGGEAAGDSVAADVEAVLGSDHADALTGRATADSLFGGGGADTLAGGLGHDWLAGGAAADRMAGGGGNDTYVLEDAADLAIEAEGQGRDLVLTTRTALVLGLHLEDLSALGVGARRFTGNALDNALTGGAGADTLVGGLGADTLAGGAGIDRLFGGAGDDTYLFEAGDIVVEVAGQGFDTLRTGLAVVTLGLNLEALVATGGAARLTGNALDNLLAGGSGADTLTGGSGKDTLDGGAGIDRLFGGTGDDRYVVTAGDVVVELAGGGDDVVVATTGTAAALGLNLEALVLQGATLVTGTGNAVGNGMLGNAAANVLNGMAGDDTLDGAGGADILNGGAGRDVLTGGAGNDLFRILAVGDSTLAAPDRILDFSRGGANGVDRIDLRFIDANTFTSGDQAFAFIGAAAFTAAGQLRVIANGAGQWQALGDTNGDGIAELRIDIVGGGAPVAGWFLA